MKRSVERELVQQKPHLIWNAFIDLLAIEDYDDLSPLQRKAHLVFWYSSEVENGGHGQYFENRGLKQLAETVTALRDLGLACHAQILSSAVTAFSAAEPGADWSDILHSNFIDNWTMGSIDAHPPPSRHWSDTSLDTPRNMWRKVKTDGDSPEYVSAET